MQQKVSVIIPTYNCAQYITQAVDSALAQTYQNLEVIVVDDGSTDNTRDLLLSYQGKIRYILQENSGPSAARNAGIEISSGELIAFLDADDVWLPQKIELQVEEILTSPEIGLVSCGRYNVSSDLRIQQQVVFGINRYSKMQLIERLITANIIGGGSSVLLRRSAVDSVGMFNTALKVSEDCELWLRIAQKHRVRSIETPLLYYRVLANSLSASAAKTLSNQMHFISILRDRKLFPETLINRGVSFKYYCAAWGMLREGNRPAACVYVCRSFLCAPVFFIKRRHMVGLAIKILLGARVFGLLQNLLNISARGHDENYS